jgi:GTPase SAR1 family protein
MINYDIDIEKKNSNLNKIFPNIFRCLIIGPSGVGKTNLLVNLLINHKLNMFDYQKIYIYSKTLHQNKYQLLIKFFNELSQELESSEPLLTCFDNENEIILPNEINPSLKSIFIFDDVLLDKQNIIEKYFAQGRNNNISCFYLCQSYTRIPKQIVRDNANVLIMFNVDEKNMKHVYSNHVFHVFPTFSTFKDLCLKIWNNEPNNYILFNKDTNMFYTKIK